jgi:kinesin family protein 2/24
MLLNIQVRQGLAHRRTETTFKNDSSSRSHAICSIRLENTVLREAEDGRIFIVDLAGSENAADAQVKKKQA